MVKEYYIIRVAVNNLVYLSDEYHRIFMALYEVSQL